MRLSVFIADTLSTQLVIDLQKLYLNNLPEQSLLEPALTAELAQTSSRLYVTMFNDRHIGAVKVTVSLAQATLSKLCVRDITRRRGVGKNLLKQIETLLLIEGIKQIQYDLKEVPEEGRLATQAFFSDSGYVINDLIANKKL